MQRRQGQRTLVGALAVAGYVGLALAPLIGAALASDRPFRSLAVEMGVGAGFVAFALLATERLLVSRLRLAAAPFGTDALLHFHRVMALVAAAFLAAHPLLLLGPAGTASAMLRLRGGPDGGAGAIACWLVLVVVATSVGRRRLRLSYEAWRGIHAVGATLVVVLSAVHASRIGGRTGTGAVGTLLGLYVAAFLLLMIRDRVGRPVMLWRRPWSVVENRDVGASTRLLVLRPSPGHAFRFAPGSFVWLVTGATPWSGQRHPISIASSAAGPPDGSIELAVKDLGDWSGAVVPALAPGTRVWVDGPHGVFTPDRETWDGLLLIAGGIGITPMRSIVRTMRDRADPRPVVLFHAARNWSRAVFREDLQALAPALDLRLVWVLERPDGDWRGPRGLLTAEILRAHLPPDLAGWECFVCGPPAMLDAMERVLPTLGVSPARTHTERFEVV